MEYSAPPRTNSPIPVSRIRIHGEKPEPPTLTGSAFGMATTPIAVRRKTTSEASDYEAVTPLVTEAGQKVFVYPPKPEVNESKPVFNYPNKVVVEVLQDGHTKDSAGLLETAQKTAAKSISKLPVEGASYTRRQHTAEEDIAEAIAQSYENLELVRSLKPLIKKKKFPLPEKINKSFDTSALSPEKGEFFTPMDCDVFIDNKEQGPSHEEFKHLSRSPTVCTLVPRQCMPHLRDGLKEEFRTALNSTNVVLQLKLDDDTCLPFYSSHDHMSGNDSDPADEYTAADTIEKYISRFAPGAESAVYTLVREEVFNELVRNYRDAYGIDLDVSGKRGTGSEVRITFMEDGQFRVDAKVAYDRYQGKHDTRLKRGFTELKLALHLTKDKEIWVPGWTNCRYDVTKKRAYRSKRDKSGLNSGSSSGGSSRQSLASGRSRSIGRSLDFLTSSFTALHKLGLRADDAKDSTEDVTGELLQYTEPHHRHSISYVLNSQISAEPFDQAPVHVRGCSEDLSRPPFESTLTVPTPDYQRSSSQSLVASGTTRSTSPVHSTLGTIEPIYQRETSVGEYDDSQVSSVSYRGAWCFTNLPPMEAVYKIFMSGELNSWTTVEKSVTKAGDMASMLRQMGVKPPFPHYFKTIPEKVQYALEGRPKAGYSDTFQVAPEIVEQVQADYTKAWFMALEGFDNRVKNYKPEMDFAEPGTSNLSLEQETAYQDFMAKIEETKQKYIAVSGELDTMTHLGSNTFDAYRDLVLRLVDIKVRLNQLNGLARGDRRTTVVKPPFVVMQEKAGVSENSPQAFYVKVCLQQLNVWNLLCSAKLDVALGRLSLSKAMDSKDDLLETIRGQIVNTQNLTTDGAENILQELWGEYWDRVLEKKVQSSHDSSLLEDTMQRTLMRRNPDFAKVLSGGSLLGAGEAGMKSTEDGVEYSDV